MIFLQIADSLSPEGDDPFVNAPVDLNLLERAAREALLVAEAGADADITIVLSDDDQLQQLNREFLGIDAPTDVLSFPSDETDPDSQTVYLGDIILSYPRAQAQATAAGYAVEDELQLLVVHGVLHLLGYDHAEEEEKAVMWAVQSQVLTLLGLHNVGLTNL